MDTSIPQKRCSRCQQLKPATLDYFWAHGQKTDKLNPRCKECENELSRAKYVKKEREILPEGHKRCGGCKTVLPATIVHFSRYKSGLKSRCRTCRKEEGKVYNDAHAEDYRQYYQEHREKVLNYHKHYYSINREQVNKRSRQSYNSARRRMYQQTHALQYRSYNNNRRALKENAPGTYTYLQIQEQLKRQHYKCYYAACGFAKFKKRGENYIFQIEHVVPLTRGGSNDISNIVLACPQCNNSKKARLPHEFPEGGRLL